MGKYEKLLQKSLQGSSDANIPFNDLCQLLRRFGFEERPAVATTFLREQVSTGR
jgi:hypothetical protein